MNRICFWKVKIEIKSFVYEIFGKEVSLRIGEADFESFGPFSELITLLRLTESINGLRKRDRVKGGRLQVSFCVPSHVIKWMGRYLESGSHGNQSTVDLRHLDVL
ncbi:hypothetical protein L204_100080 [Cryptococcus depauperatus]